jgi:hypothetical protein
MIHPETEPGSRPPAWEIPAKTAQRATLFRPTKVSQPVMAALAAAIQAFL